MLSKIVEQIQEANPELLGMDDVIEKEILPKNGVKPLDLSMGI